MLDEQQLPIRPEYAAHFLESAQRVRNRTERPACEDSINAVAIQRDRRSGAVDQCHSQARLPCRFPCHT